jgi:hypothetical protein
MKRILFIASVVAGLFAGMTANAQKDARTREYITPVRVVWTNSTDLISNPDALLQEGNGQADFMERTFCDMKSTRKVHPAIILDFGKELHGGLQIVTGMGSDHNVRVRVRFGESVSETMSEIDGKNGAKNDHAIRDQEVLLPWFGVKEIGNSGFRFVRIDLISDNKELSLKEVRAIALYRDVPYRGAFKSNDERLNQIWQTGAYTVHQCMQEFLWDGIKRDRLVWMGDMHPEIMTISNVFGYNEVVPKSLDLARDSTPLPGWMNGMYPYSMWWVLAQRDWYWYNGDKEYLEQQREYLLGLLELFHKRVDEKGFELSGGDFLDWPSEENEPAQKAGVQALMMMTMKSAAELCDILGETAMAQRCRDCHARMASVASQVSEEYYKVALAPGEPGSKQGTSLMVLADMIDAKKANEEVIKVEGARGFSTFYGYYMLQAMAKAGDYAGAMKFISEFWGAMIDLGATTFWEDFHTDWLKEDVAPITDLVPAGKKDIHGDFGAYCYKGLRHSLCHGWASGPTAWLSEHILGVEILEPGCRKVRITPHLGDLEWAEGTFPTPYGQIEIRHTRNADGKVTSKIKAPKGVKVVR